MLNKLNLNFQISIEDIIFILIACVIIFFFPGILSQSPELDCAIKFGSYIIGNFDISSVNIITYTHLSPYWVNVNWLYNIIIGFLYNAGSYSLIFNLSAIVIALVFSIIFRIMMLKYNNWFINSCLLIIGIIACNNILYTSSKLISYLFFLILFILLEKCYNKGFSRNKYIIIFVISLLWSNINIDFIMGLVLIISYSFALYIPYLFNKDNILKNKAEKYFLCLLLAIAATFINPFFYKVYVMPVNLFTSNMYKFNSYLASPNFHLFNPFGYYEILILITIFLALFSNYKPQIYKILVFIVFLMISLYSGIMIPYFVILILPFLSEVISQTKINLNFSLLTKLKDYTSIKIYSWKPLLSIAFVFIVMLAGIFNIPDYNNAFYKEILPVNAVSYLKQKNYTGKILAPANWNCYISNNLNCKVFLTSNTFFPDLKTTIDFERIDSVYKDFIKTLNKHNIEWVIYPEDSFLIQQLQQNTEWQKVYKNKKIVIYKKISTPSVSNLP